MKSPFLRLLISAFCLSIIIGLITAGIGVLLGWSTSARFSDGLFIAGGLFMCIGAISFIGGNLSRADFTFLYAGSVGDESIADRTRHWVAAMTQGYDLLLLLFVTGLLLIGLSVLVDVIF